MKIRLQQTGLHAFGQKKVEPTEPTKPAPVDTAKLKADVDRLAAYWGREAQRKAAANPAAKPQQMAAQHPQQRTAWRKPGFVPSVYDLMEHHGLPSSAASELRRSLANGVVPAALAKEYGDLSQA